MSALNKIRTISSTKRIISLITQKEKEGKRKSWEIYGYDSFLREPFRYSLYWMIPSQCKTRMWKLRVIRMENRRKKHTTGKTDASVIHTDLTLQNNKKGKKGFLLLPSLHAVRTKTTYTYLFFCYLHHCMRNAASKSLRFSYL